jgi:hypothetical protein
VLAELGGATFYPVRMFSPLSSDPREASPCSWTTVRCDDAGQIMSVHALYQAACTCLPHPAGFLRLFITLSFFVFSSLSLYA